jgi:antitoxin ParD1/3/4
MKATIGAMSARNISLTVRLATFIDEQVETGRHQNASEVVREALRRYEDDIEAEAVERAALRAIVREGRAAIARGEFTIVRDTEEARAVIGRIGKRAAKRARSG